MKRASIAVAAALLFIAACSEVPIEQTDPGVQQVVVTASATGVEAGQTVQLTAVAKQADGTVRGDVAIEWSIADTAIAHFVSTNANTAVIRGKQGGLVEVRARAETKTGSIQITVTNAPPPPSPSPTLSSLEPATAQQGGAGLLLHIRGKDFTPGSYVQWNAVSRQTVFVNATELNVVVTPADLQAAGTANIRVITPQPGGGVTDALQFAILGVPASIELIAEAWPDIFLTGEQAVLTLTAKDTLGRTLPDVQAEWTSSLPSVATVDQRGRIALLHEGQTTVRVRVGALKAEKVVNVAPAPTSDVIYDALEDGVRQLFISTPGVAGRRRVFSTIVPATDPAPSPDGQRIAFVGVGTNGNADIFVADRDGSHLQQLTFDPQTDDQPAWSPDGKRIAFQSQRDGGYHNIWVMNADGSGITNLTNDEVRINQTGFEHPAWSPDGQYLIMSMSDYGMTPRRSVLVRLRLSDDMRTVLANDPSLSDAEAAYGTRSNTIALRRTFSNSLGDQIQFMNPLTGETWILLDYPGQGRKPAIARDDQWLAFESSPPQSPSATGVYLNWIGTAYRRVIGAGAAAGNPANPSWLVR